MRRARLLLICLAVLAVAAIAFWYLSRDNGPGAADGPTQPSAAVPVTIEYVYDGDSLEVSAHDVTDLLDTTAPVDVRLIGIDAPEGTPTVQCGADEARNALRDLLPEGSTAWAIPDAEAEDRYERRLLYLWNDDGVLVNHALVALGHAEPLVIEPNTTYAPVLAAAAQEARNANAGVWGTCR